MNVVDRQELLSEATPRPWKIDPAYPCDIGHPGDNSEGEWDTTVGSSADPDDAELIVMAVNEYEALLACETGLRALVGFLRPDNRHAIHARDALERLDNLREAR